ncbi:unnamed protein product [Moneuplotes crassus]|uniref:Uncharacterized protein n=1 Tax=Euplotes crassus TaxID=5936 RepID=A0AAD1XV14_EUPCR|nr:unnamed protein product [Moneuplotes crassus]
MSLRKSNATAVRGRGAKKREIRLRKNFKANWGRFLDNHYDPNIHNKPFSASMHASKDSYTYSSAGLSHKFVRSSVLQSCDFEQRKDRTKAVMRFKEQSELQNGDVVVVIEYCSNSEKTQLSTNHSEKKYQAFAKRFRHGILEKFPDIKVFVKSTHNPDKVVHYKVNKGIDGNIIEDQREQRRIGAFEITLSHRQDDFTQHFQIFSKLKSQIFPKLDRTLSKICEYVPKCNLLIQICDNVQDPSIELHPEKAEGIAVKLRISFKDTKAAENLDLDVKQIEAERMNKTPSKSSQARQIGSAYKGNNSYMNRRLGSAINPRSSGNFHAAFRPYSAKTEFSNTSSRNPYNRGNFSNRLMSSHNMLNKTPSMKFLPERSQTATATKTLRSASSIGKVKTFVSPYNVGPQTTTSMAKTFVRNRKPKKPKPPVQDLVFQGIVSKKGIVIFEQIPRTMCGVESSENEFFKNACKTINLPAEAVKDGKVEVYLPVERQDVYSTTVYMLRNDPNEEEQKEEQANLINLPKHEEQDEHATQKYFENLTVRAILLELFQHKDSKSESEDSDFSESGSEIDYEEELEQTVDYRGCVCYKGKLLPGKYMIIAKGREIKEFSKIIEIREQLTNVSCTPEQDYQKEISVLAFNAMTGEELSNVLLRLRKGNSKISSEGLTKSKGGFVYTINENSPHCLQAERKGFIPSFLEINQTRGNESNSVVKIPMVPVQKIKKVEVTDHETKDITEMKPSGFKVVLISDDESSLSSLSLSLSFTIAHPENDDEEEIQVSESCQQFDNETITMEYKDHGEFGKFIAFQAIGDESTNKWFRVSAKINSPNLTDPSKFQLDQNFKNTLQDHNVKVLIFNHKRLISVVYSPSFITNMSYWDIGFLNPSRNKFIKVNATQEEFVGAKSYTRFYMRFYKYLNEKGPSFNIKSKLGFDSQSAILKSNDTVITDDKDFVKAIQSLDINWISENLLEGASERTEGMHTIKDDILKTREAELNEFYKVLSNGFRNLFGEISLRMTQSLLEPHLGIVPASPQKMRRVINRSSRKIYF